MEIIVDILLQKLSLRINSSGSQQQNMFGLSVKTFLCISYLYVSEKRLIHSANGVCRTTVELLPFDFSIPGHTSSEGNIYIYIYILKTHIWRYANFWRCSMRKYTTPALTPISNLTTHVPMLSGYPTRAHTFSMTSSMGLQLLSMHHTDFRTPMMSVHLEMWNLTAN